MKLSQWEPDLASVVKRIDNRDIDLQPNFQRQEVWSLAKKKRLIDTVLREWSIPAVHLVVTKDDRMEVLDGQQRLASIRDFVHDDFTIDGNIAPADERVKCLHGLRFSQLDPQTRRRIDNYTIRAFRITEYLPEEPNELFYRLNQPTALTAGEQRNALFGIARDQLKFLVSEFESRGNNKDTVGFSNSRMAYDDIFAKYLFFVERGTFGIKSTESLISDRFKKPEPFSDHVMQRCSNTIHIFSLMRDMQGRYRFNKANLLSWLLFLTRFQHFNNYDFFERFANGISSGHDLAFSARHIFDDRSSLRVSDVSSVVYRDVCLWLQYVYWGYADLPAKIPVGCLRHIIDAYRSRDDANLEHVLSEILNVDIWSVSL